MWFLKNKSSIFENEQIYREDILDCRHTEGAGLTENKAVKGKWKQGMPKVAATHTVSLEVPSGKTNGVWNEAFTKS